MEQGAHDLGISLRGTKRLSIDICPSGPKGLESIYYSIPFLTKDKKTFYSIQ